MLCMNINKKPLYYALKDTQEEILDEYNNKTGQYLISYKKPVEKRLNISAANGNSDVNMFGISDNYTHTAMTNDIECPIAEDTIAWMGLPKYITEYNVETLYKKDSYCIFDNGIYKCNDNTTGIFDLDKWEEIPHNTVIIKVAKSINSITYALKRVDVSV